MILDSCDTDRIPTARRSRSLAASFTLVELMVVLVIMGVMVAMFVPQFAGSITSTALRESSQQLVVAARYGHRFAATRRRLCRLTIDLKENRFGLDYEVDPLQRPDVFEPVRQDGIRLTALRRDIRFDGVITNEDDQNKDVRVIKFHPRGGATAAVIRITDGRRTWSVLIEPGTGRAVAVDRAVTELPVDREDLDA